MREVTCWLLSINIQSDVAPGDICEMFDAALEYGGYGEGNR
jgi:hypothetical protein